MDKTETFYNAITELISEKSINSIAEKFCSGDKRTRKMPIDCFFWTILLTHNVNLMFGGLNEAVSRFREITLIHSGKILDISRMAISKKLSKRSWKLFQNIFQKLFELYPVENSSLLGGVLLKLKQVDVIDSTAIKIYRLFKKKYPSQNKEMSQIKIHTKYDLKKHLPKEILITGQRLNDKKYDFISEESNILYIFDLGYWAFKIFDKIISTGNFFVSRLREDSNPSIISTDITLNGKLVRTVTSTTKENVIDFKCKLAKYRSNPMQNNVRIVGVKTEEKWHLYVTNLSEIDFTPEIISKIYTLRWQIEIFFNELKHLINLNRIFSQSENGIMIEIYSSLIYYTIIQTAILLSSEETGNPVEYYSFIRTARIVKEILSVYQWMPSVKNLSEVLKMIVELVKKDGMKDTFYINKKLKPFFK